MKKNKDKIGLLAILAVSGGLVVGADVGKPECDYVIQETEICLSAEQAEAILEQLAETKVGFGTTEFEGTLKLLDGIR